MMDAGPDADAAPPMEDAGPPIRTVEQRNPFGDVAIADNLLWDGDFEWASPFSDEYGWLTGPPYSYALPDIVIGAQCKSGVKCAKLKKGRSLLGVAVASQGNKLEVRAAVFIKGGACDKMKVTLTSITGGEDAVIAPVSKGPADDGWCHYLGTTDVRKTKPYLLIHNGTTDDVMVDDAVLRKAPPNALHPLFSGPVTADDAAALAAAQDAIRAHETPHDAPPNEAKKALEAWKAR
jgi:hypothetical protein